MRAALPRPSALKFVVMLRRPEERAASHFRMLGKLARRGEEWAQAGTPCPGPPHPAPHAPRPSQSTSTPPPLLWLRPTANPNLHQVYVANHSLDSKLRAEATAFAACARAYAAAAQSRGEGDGGVGGMPAQARQRAPHGLLYALSPHSPPGIPRCCCCAQAWHECVAVACGFHSCVVAQSLYAPQLRGWLGRRARAPTSLFIPPAAAAHAASLPSCLVAASRRANFLR